MAFGRIQNIKNLVIPLQEYKKNPLLWGEIKAGSSGPGFCTLKSERFDKGVFNDKL
jgi:hypothetical protein